MATYESLIKHVAISENELQKECSLDVLLKVSENFTKWRSTAPFLELDDAAVENIEQSRHDEEGKRQAILKEWKRRFDFEATYERLIKCFLKARRADLARIVAEERKKEAVCTGAVASDSSTGGDEKGLLQSEKKEIFLSYGHEEGTSQFVRQLQEDLVKNGFTVWFDKTDIPTFKDWRVAIAEGLQHCKAIVAVITNKYIESEYCDMELCHAQSKGKEKFPILYGKVDFDASDKARKVDMILSRFQCPKFVQGQDDYASFLKDIVKGLKEKGLGAQ